MKLMTLEWPVMTAVDVTIKPCCSRATCKLKGYKIVLLSHISVRCVNSIAIIFIRYIITIQGWVWVSCLVLACAILDELTVSQLASSTSFFYFIHAIIIFFWILSICVFAGETNGIILGSAVWGQIKTLSNAKIVLTASCLLQNTAS